MSLNLFEIGKSALLASRRAMDVTGHNVANAATPGYSRQEVVLQPIVQRETTVSGMGVRVTQIRRLRDFFTDCVLRNENANRAFFAVQRDVMDQIQVMSAESSDSGLRAAIENFWIGWQELSISPDSEPARTALLEQGRSLIDMFRHMAGQLDSLQEDIGKNIDANIQRLNSLAETVATLNAEIGRAAARQSPMGDLLDRRDLLLDEIAEISGASVSQYNDGTLAVRVTVNGYPLVDRTSSFKLAAKPTPEGGLSTHGSTRQETASRLQRRRKLGGLATSKNELVHGFKENLELLLRDIVDMVNGQYIKAEFSILPIRRATALLCRWRSQRLPVYRPVAFDDPADLVVWDGDPFQAGQRPKRPEDRVIARKGRYGRWPRLCEPHRHLDRCHRRARDTGPKD